MALPKPSTPKYQVTLPSSGKIIYFRPFLVKDQKAIIIAMQEQDDGSAIETFLEVVQNCVVEDIDIKSLPLIDVEWLMLKIRQKSIGEIIELSGKCDVCSTSTDFQVNLEEVEVTKSIEDHSIVKIDDTISVKFKAPSVDLISLQQGEDSNQFMANCIEEIYDGEAVYSASEQTREDLLDFIESLDTMQFQAVEKYFDSLPKIKKDISYTCKKCGKVHSLELEGLNSFFI